LEDFEPQATRTAAAAHKTEILTEPRIGF